jgi:hypothetical protein
LRIKVKPNSRESLLESLPDGSWVARVKAPPIEGRANAELVVLVAKSLGVARSSVTIRSGAGGRTKLVQVAT